MKAAVVRVLGGGRPAAFGLCGWEGTILLNPIFTPRLFCASSVPQTNRPLQNLNQHREILERVASALGVVEVYS